MRILICDTNILIDLEEGRLLEQFFQLPYDFRVSDILFSEELEAQAAYERMKANHRRLPWTLAWRQLEQLCF